MAAVSMLARAQLRRSLRTMILLGLLAGVALGIVIGSVQLARRTSTAYERLEKATGAPDAVLLALGGPAQARAITALRAVEDSWTLTSGIAQVGQEPVRYLGVVAPKRSAPPAVLSPIIVRGRAAHPDAAGELVLSEHFSEGSGLEVGDHLPLAFLTRQEIGQFDTGFGQPDGPKVDMRVVGVARVAIDEGVNAIGAFGTPALARVLDAGGAGTYPTVLVRLQDGDESLPGFQRSVHALSAASPPAEGSEEFSGIEIQVPGRQRSVIAVTARVQVVGLTVFLSLAGVSGLLAVALALRRHFLVAMEPDLDVLAAMGCTRRDLRGARVLVVLPLVAVTTVVCVVVAAVLGVFEPIGSMRTREPATGWHVNLAVVAVGAIVAAFVVLFVALAVGPRRGRARRPSHSRPSVVVGRLVGIGAPATVVVGTRLALEPGRGRTAVPVRSTLVGVAIGVLGLVGVTVYASSIQRLVETPSRWGWRSDAEFVDVRPELRQRIASDGRITAASLVEETQVELGGRSITAEALRDEKGGGSVSWTILDGRLPEPGEVVLGARLARDLDRTVGDRVRMTTKSGRAVTLEVVGIGAGPNLQNQQFAGGLLIAPSDVDTVGTTQPFRAATVEFADGVDVDAEIRDYAADAETERPSRPPDVDNLAQLGALPELLVTFLVIVGVAVLLHLLVTACQRRRRDLDTLRAMGFAPRQVRSVVVIVALVTMSIGLLIGVPLGIAFGRLGWRFTADAAYVATDPRVPVALLAAIVAGVLAVAVFTAMWPAWRAARRPAAYGLREE